MAEKEYLCSACEWTGKGELLVECPICHRELTELTLGAENPSSEKKPEKYDPEKLEKIVEEENVDAPV